MLGGLEGQAGGECGLCQVVSGGGWGGAVEKLTVLTHFSAFPFVATPGGLPWKSGARPLSTGLGSLVYRVHSSIVPTLTFVFSHPPAPVLLFF